MANNMPMTTERERLAVLSAIETDAKLIILREAPLFGGRFKVRPIKLLLYVTGLWVVPVALASKTVMFDSLSNYDPVDVAAYEALQASARAGEITAASVLEWVRKERAAITSPLVTSVDAARNRFANRMVHK